MKIKNLIPILAVFALGSCNGVNSGTGENSDSTALNGELNSQKTYQTVEFEASDSLLVTANLYEADPSFPMIVLCHQMGFCKYEYAGVAERFNELGYNCLAIDQRCGGPIAENRNETWLRAKEQKKSTADLEAEKDIVAAIDYAHAKYDAPVILLGSSYSSTLCLYQAIENEKVSAVIAFSPGNYYYYDGFKPDLTILMTKFEKPFFLTGANNDFEMPFIRELVLGRQRTENQTVFFPAGEGAHGARVLWPTQEDGEEYWAALEKFLEDLP